MHFLQNAKVTTPIFIYILMSRESLSPAVVSNGAEVTDQSVVANDLMMMNK